MGDESSEQEGFSDIMSEEGEKKPTKKGDGNKKVHFTKDDEEDALDEDEVYGDEEEGEGEMEEDGEEGMEDEDDEADEEESEEEMEKAPVKPIKPVKTTDQEVLPATLDNPEIEKALRSVLNKVSEGNIEVMFTNLMDLVKKFVGKGTGKPSLKVAMFAHCYAKIFIQMNISSQQQMNAILSVNCALVCGI
jgi:hypothetical protein